MRIKKIGLNFNFRNFVKLVILSATLFTSFLVSNTALYTAASNEVGSVSEGSVETWTFNFTLRFPAAYICANPINIIYLHPDHDPPQPGCIDFDPEQIPELSELAGSMFPIIPIGDEPLEIEVTQIEDAISASFEFNHSYTGSLIIADLSGSIVEDQVSFTIIYHLPSDLQHYSMPLSRNDILSEMEGNVNYTLPTQLTCLYQGTLHDGRINGYFNNTIEAEFAVWSFHMKGYVVNVDPYTGHQVRDYLMIEADAEWRFSKLRTRGYFTINTDRVPVLLVHGWHGNRNSLDAFKSWLEDDGYHVEVLEYDSSQYAEVAARELSEKVQEMLNDSDEVDIIAHSYGGLVSRYYIEKMDGDENVRNLIMLGTPNHGSQLADFVTDPPEKLVENIVKLFLDYVSGRSLTEVRTWASTYHLRTTSNPLLDDLNPDLNLAKIDTKYFVIAGTSHFPFPLKLTSWYRILPGHDDGLVTVDSASLEYKGVPLYCVKLNHLDIVSTLARDVYTQIVRPILQDSAPDPSMVGSICPESEDPDDMTIRDVLELLSHTVTLGDIVEGSFQVTVDHTLLEVGIIFPSCDFNFTLLTPTGSNITPELVNQTADVDYFMLENYWYYIIKNPEVGEWRYCIIATEVPEEGVEIVFSSIEIIPEIPSSAILPVFMVLSAIAIVFAKKKILKRQKT